jgi:serine kinase of HPr protein (carbohydrate metabolism regulator)
MIKIDIITAGFVSIILLAGCAGDIKTKKLATGEHIIQADEGKIISSRVGIQNNFDSTALELCPHGHTLIAQKKQEIGRYSRYLWKIRCIDATSQEETAW